MTADIDTRPAFRVRHEGWRFGSFATPRCGHEWISDLGVERCPACGGNDRIILVASAPDALLAELERGR